ncbi:MAG: VTT domain-containing protein [Rhodocyclaceae bacterium]|nr:VTT domain-containing protein [Rhodocyclaceae bacterium]MBK9624029.1 VTT domain-containing protein [Rhodocyclaceae bacterium]MBL0076204.1 VTT domain-containing protein [Rhodocyclaceae bacterium]MBP6279181.1 VTT domain-containing protein [Rhodocyclaceae bacterium]
MRKYKRLLAVLAFLALLLAIVQLSGLRDNFSLEFLQHQILAHQVAGLLVFVVLFSIGNLIQIPGWIFLAAAVLTLGKLMGGLATYAAASASCVVTFLVIKAIGGDALRQLDNKIALRIFRRLDTHPIRSIALLRMLFQTVPALNYALALSGIKFRHYLVGTLVGLPIPISLYCLFFDYLAKLLIPTTSA